MSENACAAGLFTRERAGRAAASAVASAARRPTPHPRAGTTPEGRTRAPPALARLRVGGLLPGNLATAHPADGSKPSTAARTVSVWDCAVHPVRLVEGGLLATFPPPTAASAQRTSGAAPSGGVGGGWSQASRGPDARGRERRRACHRPAQQTPCRRSPCWGTTLAGVLVVDLSRKRPRCVLLSR